MIPDTEEAEANANRFAAAFTLPKDDLLAELPWGRLQLTDLMMIKKQFGVSMQMVAMSARRAGVISQAELTRLYRELGCRGWRTNEPGGQLANNAPVVVVVMKLIEFSKAAKSPWVLDADGDGASDAKPDERAVGERGN